MQEPHGMQRHWQQDPNSTTRHAWRLNQLGQADDDDIYQPPRVTRDDLRPKERAQFKLHDPIYTVKVFGDLYRDMLETCFDKCVEHPAGDRLSNNASTCIRACGLLYHESFNHVVQENGRRLTLMRYLADEQRAL